MDLTKTTTVAHPLITNYDGSALLSLTSGRISGLIEFGHVYPNAKAYDIRHDDRDPDATEMIEYVEGFFYRHVPICFIYQNVALSVKFTWMRDNEAGKPVLLEVAHITVFEQDAQGECINPDVFVSVAKAGMGFDPSVWERVQETFPRTKNADGVTYFTVKTKRAPDARVNHVTYENVDLGQVLELFKYCIDCYRGLI